VSAAPAAAEPGESITSQMEYVVVGSDKELEIAEEWEILKEGKRLTTTSPRVESRGAGGWRVSVSIGLPRGAEPGIYVIRSRVSTGGLADVRDAGFTVLVPESTPLRKARKANAAEAADPELMQVQARLKELGHDPGPSDGRMRAQTQAALKSLQEDYGLAATGEVDAQTLAALDLGKPPERRPCAKASGTVKDYLHNPADASSGRAIEVCDTGADYRLDGRIIVPKIADHPAFAPAAIDDLANIASVSDASAHVGFEFLVQLLETLSENRGPAGDRAIYIRWGGATNGSQPDELRAVTRPGTSSGSPTSAEWEAATSQGLDVYGNDGAPVGGAAQYFKGLSKGTGGGIGATVYYRPEALPDLKTCPAGQTSDVALLHELQHAAHMVQGSVDNTPYSSRWWSKDPLAAGYGVHDEKLVVERENEYRAALKEKYPSRYPNLRPRRSYLGDC